MPSPISPAARVFRVYIGTMRASCALPSYWAAVLWARDFADAVAGQPLGAPLTIVWED